ncbi:MAG: MFS transporter [Candidatus Bathyarchaeota archaeon]|nr:MFS transporter [Candidatus Bathyarchaeota archaeon]
MQKETLLPLIAVGTLSSLGVGLLGPVYPIFVVNRFSASLIDVGLLYMLVLLTAALVKAPAGRLVDLYGKEKIFFSGLMLGAACTLAYTVVTSIVQLYFVEFFFATAYALQRPALLAFIVDASDKDKRGLLLGTFESAYDIAEAIAAIASTIIVSQIGFETLFLISSSCQATTGIFVLKASTKP